LAEYRVNLDQFAGPLDLLLYLVRRDELDIYDIPIARITEEYLMYVGVIKQIDIDRAGDFLVMAATLMEIKSAMLLPQSDSAAGLAEEIGDPRAELVRQLLEYKKFKDAANLLEATVAEHGRRFGRPDALLSRLEPQSEARLDLDQVSVWNLLEAFDLILRATGGPHSLDHIKDDTPIDLYEIEILHFLQTEGPVLFARIFGQTSNRLRLIGLFLALLELVREQLVWAEQDRTSGIYLRALTDEPAEQAVQNAIANAERLLRRGHDARQQPAVPIRQIPAIDSGKIAAPDQPASSPDRTC
jgi:segregation and condensation protein A